MTDTPTSQPADEARAAAVAKLDGLSHTASKRVRKLTLYAAQARRHRRDYLAEAFDVLRRNGLSGDEAIFVISHLEGQ